MAQPPEWPYAESLIQAAIAEYGRPESYFEERFFWPTGTASRDPRGAT